jgi:hypothetical protein
MMLVSTLDITYLAVEPTRLLRLNPTTPTPRCQNSPLPPPNTQSWIESEEIQSTSHKKLSSTRNSNNSKPPQHIIMSAPNSNNNIICSDQLSALEGLIALSGAPPILAGAVEDVTDEAKPKHREEHRRFCCVDGCANRVVQGGVCMAHGAKRRKCSVEGCDKNVKKEGKCSMHG